MWFKYIIREYINKQTSQIRRWFQIEHFFTHMTRDNRHIIKYSHHTGGATNQTQPWFYVQDLCFQIQSLTKERALLNIASLSSSHQMQLRIKQKLQPTFSRSYTRKLSAGFDKVLRRIWCQLGILQPTDSL